MVNRNHKLMLFCFFYGATAADQLAESTLKSEYRAGGDSLISTDSEECRTVQSHVGLPRWLPPLHEKDTATYSPPVQILHKQRDPIPKTTNRVLFKKKSDRFSRERREKDSQCNHIPQYVSYVLLSSISSHTYFTEQNTNLSYVALVLHFRFQILLIISAIVVFSSAQKNSENL